MYKDGFPFIKLTVEHPCAYLDHQIPLWHSLPETALNDDLTAQKEYPLAINEVVLPFTIVGVPNVPEIDSDAIFLRFLVELPLIESI